MMKYPLAILSVLLVNIAYAVDTTEIKFVDVPNVAEATEPFNVTLIAQDVPEGEELWIFAYPLNTKRFYPVGKRFISFIEVTKNKLAGTVRIGSANDPDLAYKLFAVVADKNANQIISGNINNKVALHGLKELPSGVKIYDSRMIMMKGKRDKPQRS